MFKFLKEKLKKAVQRITKKVETEVEDTIEQVKEKEDAKKVKKDKPKKERKKREIKAEKKEPEIIKHAEEGIEEAEGEIHEGIGEVKEETEKEKKGFFGKIFRKKEEAATEEAKIGEKSRGIFSRIKERIVTKRISGEKFNELFSELEISLLENNVAFEVVEKIKDDLKMAIVDKPIKRGEIDKTIIDSLKSSIDDTLTFESMDMIKMIKQKKDKPFVIVFVGTNGSGKTTTISKVASLLKSNKLSVVMAAADTFRAASIEQLREWGDRLNVKVIAHDYGADPAAVSFDSLKYSKAHNIDVVLIDTAGRQHSNVNLMSEMEKIVRVTKPDLKIFIGESLAGNDVVMQSQEFDRAVDIDCIILTKADVDEKGGAMISVAYVTKKPIIYLGTGQELKDLEAFDKNRLIQRMAL